MIAGVRGTSRLGNEKKTRKIWQGGYHYKHTWAGGGVGGGVGPCRPAALPGSYVVNPPFPPVKKKNLCFVQN